MTDALSPLDARPLMGVVAPTVGVLSRLAWRVRVRGAEHVPATGPAILVANHSGVLDGPLVAAVCPRAPHFLVKQELYAGLLGRVLTALGQVPVDRTTGDRRALTAARGVLDGGEIVGIFPEGTRGAGEVESVQQGAAWLAIQSGAVVVPVACHGTRPAGRGVGALPRPRARIDVVFGEPFVVDEAALRHPDEDPAARVPGRERLRRATALVHDRLRAHVAATRSPTGR